MKHFTLILLLLGIGLYATAQDKRPHLSKEAFRERQKAYITQQAELTPEEAEKFFVLYFELQDKKDKLNKEMGCMLHDMRKQDCKEAEYAATVDKMMQTRVLTDRLEQRYIRQYQAFLTHKKVFRILLSETRFFREMIREPRQRTVPTQRIKRK